MFKKMSKEKPYRVSKFLIHIGFTAFLLTLVAANAWSKDEPHGARELWLHPRGHVQHLLIRGSEAKTQKTILLLHGSPGDMRTWQGFWDRSVLSPKFRLIAIDRQGYGQSDPGAPEPSLGDQATFIHKALMSVSKNRKVTVVGYSYAGAVAARLAADYPEDIESILFIAPTLAPSLSGAKWYEALCNIPLINLILPSTLVSLGVEAAALPDELEVLQPDLKTIKVPVYYLQGLKDTSVSLLTAGFVERSFTGTNVRIQFVPDMDHSIPERRPDIVNTALLRLTGI
jgi:pimeloyl-ACP methyl ester carboxylesterase